MGSVLRVAEKVSLTSCTGVALLSERLVRACCDDTRVAPKGFSMPSPVLSRRDLDFLLYDWLDIESLTSRDRFAEHSRETFDAVLDLSSDIATKHFATHN